MFIKSQEELESSLEKVQPLQMSDDKKRDSQKATVYCICKKEFTFFTINSILE